MANTAPGAPAPIPISRITPGNWSVAPFADNPTWAHVQSDAIPIIGLTVCTARIDDAHLIAAAPALLAAAKEAEARLAREKWRLDDTFNPEAMLRRALFDAIAKAQGGTA